jgi:DNA repair exonuclease SbcCD ATPase subunit
MSEDVERIELASALRSMLRRIDDQLVSISDAALKMRGLLDRTEALEDVLKKLQEISRSLKGVNDRLDAIVDLATECRDADAVAREVASFRKYLENTLRSDQFNEMMRSYERARPERIDMIVRYFVEAARGAVEALEENRRQLVALAESLGMGDAAARAEEDVKGWAEGVLNLTKRLMESLGIREEARQS